MTLGMWEMQMYYKNCNSFMVILNSYMCRTGAFVTLAQVAGIKSTIDSYRWFKANSLWKK